jgi:hypothetical protein
MHPWIMCPRTHDPPSGNSLPPSPSAGVSVDEWVGDELPPRKASGSTRVYFVNANGIRYGARGGKMNEVCARVLEGNIDIIGIAETKLDTKMACVVHTCHQSVRGYFDTSLTPPNSLWPAARGVMAQHTNRAAYFN